MLSQIAQAEALIRSLGFRDLRVRHHDTSARIELIPEDLQRASSPSVISFFEGGIEAERVRYSATRFGRVQKWGL